MKQQKSRIEKKVEPLKAHSPIEEWQTNELLNVLQIKRREKQQKRPTNSRTEIRSLILLL